jgi:ABC-type multidrug transport system fused ATPase/permease subunit
LLLSQPGEILARQLQAVFALVVGCGLSFASSWKISLVIIAVLPLNLFALAAESFKAYGKQ